ncbi:hypothetical protein SVIOM342S_04993 [Streptomyces violaceorubidus]
MPQLAFANSFWESYDSLEKPVKAGVRKAMQKFQLLSVPELHADKGLHLESVQKAQDTRMRTIRINDFWRGVVLAPDDGSDVFLLVNVVRHDDAYTWAAKRLYTTNSATRALEVRNVAALEQLTPALEKAAAAADSLLFAKYSDGVLRELGIDDQVLRAVRTIVDEAQLKAFETLLPEDQCEVLQYLAEGFGPDEVYRDVVAVRRPADSGLDPDESLAVAIANTTSRITLVSGPEDLADILEKPFTAWRVFLHPSQRRVAYRVSYGGPVQITGGPGTGKTVAALHRVKHLLSRSPDTRVLLTTYTNALASSLRENLSLLLDDDAALLGRVDVTTVNAYAHGVVTRLDGRAPSPVNYRDERQLWQRVVKQLGLPWTEQFLAQEYRNVVLAQDLRTAEAYRSALRRGRGSALPSARRDRLWSAVELFESMLRAQKATTHLKVCARAADLLAGSAPTHDHVVVDEAQDLHPAQWRVLRGAVAAGGDDLFITGDPHQRIYDSKVSLASLGIPVTGRTHRLRINYRSTEEILVLVDGHSQPGLGRRPGWRRQRHPGRLPFPAARPSAARGRVRLRAGGGRRTRRTRRGLDRPRHPAVGDRGVRAVQRAARQGLRQAGRGRDPRRPCQGQPRARPGRGAARHHARHEGAGVPLCRGPGRDGRRGAVRPRGDAGLRGRTAARRGSAARAVSAVRGVHAGAGGSGSDLEWVGQFVRAPP